jgi:hypothetical protein
MSEIITERGDPRDGIGNEMPARYVTDEERERYRLYRLCDCTTCGATGRMVAAPYLEKCPACRGEGRTRDLVATCATAEAVGVALVTLGREGEWDECPVGVLDTMGEPGEKWILRPWLPSARNTSQAGRVLRSAQTKGKT